MPTHNKKGNNNMDKHELKNQALLQTLAEQANTIADLRVELTVALTELNELKEGNTED